MIVPHNMATLSFIFLAFSLLCNLSSLPLLTNASPICSDSPCGANGQICTTLSSGGGDDNNCQPSGTITCNGGGSYTQYPCSPEVSSSTQAMLTHNDFDEGGDGGDKSACDGMYHSNSESVVALSTGWFDNKSRCGKMIKITASNGKSTTAEVVDECDSVNGCDSVHAFCPPCGNNTVDGSQAVWDALGLNSDDGKAQITWSMA